MSARSPSRSCHTPSHRAHATAARKRALRVSAVEKWDVAMWNDQVHSSQEPSMSGCHPSTPQPTSADSTPWACVTQPEGSSLAGARPALSSIPCFATAASAFGFRNSTSTRPRSIPRRKSSHGPAAESHQTRLDALSALHRSIEEHDASFLARMRELEERCHLLPDSLSVLRSTDLTPSGATRGRKRDTASWGEDGDVEMSCWDERRRKHRSPRSGSPMLFGSGASTCEDKATHSSDDDYVTDHDGTDSHSSSGEEEEDDDLDIVIVSGGSGTPSLDSASSTSSLSTSLSSLPARAGSPHLHQYTPPPHIPGTIKGVDELAAAMAGGAGSVVEWSLSSDVSGDESHCINADIAQAGALWA